LASICWASVKGLAMRATALNNCCEPVNNACGVVVTDGFVSAVVTQNVSEGTDIELRNAADKVCVYSPGCDELLELQVVLTLCKVNPELISLITGQELVLNSAGVAVGMRRSSVIDCDRRFAFEIWSEVPGTACASNGTVNAKQYGYYLIPCLKGAQITGEVTFDATNALTVELTATTVVPSLWGTGPENGTNAAANYNVVPGVGNAPSHLLTPIGSKDHDHIQLTTVPPPAIPADCGCVALDNQVQIAAP